MHSQVTTTHKSRSSRCCYYPPATTSCICSGKRTSYRVTSHVKSMHYSINPKISSCRCLHATGVLMLTHHVTQFAISNGFQRSSTDPSHFTKKGFVYQPGFNVAQFRSSALSHACIPSLVFALFSSLGQPIWSAHVGRQKTTNYTGRVLPTLY